MYITSPHCDQSVQGLVCQAHCWSKASQTLGRSYPLWEDSVTRYWVSLKASLKVDTLQSSRVHGIRPGRSERHSVKGHPLYKHSHSRPGRVHGQEVGSEFCSSFLHCSIESESFDNIVNISYLHNSYFFLTILNS